MSYKELQSALKTLRNNGYKLNVKLNATKVALQAEYERIMGAQPKQEPAQDELAAAKARIAELEAQVKTQQETIEQMARIIESQAADEQAQSEPEATDVEQAIENLTEAHDAYIPVWELANALNNPEYKQMWEQLFSLARAGKIDLSTVQEGAAYTDEQMKWTWNQLPDALGAYDLGFIAVN